MASFDNDLFCPHCYSDVRLQASRLHCSSCNYETGTIDGIPWLFKEPEVVRLDWVNRYNAHLQSLQDRFSKNLATLKDRTLMKLTKERLLQINDALVFQIKALEEILKPLGSQVTDNPAINDLTNSVLPTKQQAQTYGDNIFRDWAWETDENKIHADLITKKLPVEKNQKVVVLGAGCTRLAWDLHRLWQNQATLAVDINPQLLMIAKRVLQGEAIELMEFPASPINKDFHAHKQILKSATPVDSSGFDFLFADATSPPLKDESCDVVVTPWFLDILPQNADWVIREINRILRKDGKWIYFGSYYFNSPKDYLAYSKEELLHLVSRDGFEISTSFESEVPYLHSPLSCQKRVENTLCFSAKKVKSVEVIEEEEFRPPWLLDPTQAIPMQETFNQHAFINQLHFEILTGVDGKRNLKELSEFVSQKYNLPEDEALASVRTFFVRMIEKGLFKF